MSCHCVFCLHTLPKKATRRPEETGAGSIPLIFHVFDGRGWLLTGSLVRPRSRNKRRWLPFGSSSCRDTHANGTPIVYVNSRRKIAKEITCRSEHPAQLNDPIRKYGVPRGVKRPTQTWYNVMEHAIATQAISATHNELAPRRISLQSRLTSAAEVDNAGLGTIFLIITLRDDQILEPHQLQVLANHSLEDA